MTGVRDRATWSVLGDQSFDEFETTQIDSSELPWIARAKSFVGDLDGYLTDLGIDPKEVLTHAG